MADIKKFSDINLYDLLGIAPESTEQEVSHDFM
jgi:hypothetical protein